MDKMYRLAYIHKTSNANEDLLKAFTYDQEYTKPKIKKLQMTVDKDCFLIVNGCRIKVLASLGLLLEQDFGLKSLIIETNGVAVYAIAGY